MSIKKSQQHYSDRGNIKDILVKSNITSELNPTNCELRLRSLYEYARYHKDNNLQSSLGFITTDYISDKNALPLTVYKIKSIIKDIKLKSGNKIDAIQKQLDGCFKENLSSMAMSYISHRQRIKCASVRKPTFWRVSKV